MSDKLKDKQYVDNLLKEAYSLVAICRSKMVSVSAQDTSQDRVSTTSDPRKPPMRLIYLETADDICARLFELIQHLKDNKVIRDIDTAPLYGFKRRHGLCIGTHTTIYGYATPEDYIEAIIDDLLPYIEYMIEDDQADSYLSNLQDSIRRAMNLCGGSLDPEPPLEKKWLSLGELMITFNLNKTALFELIKRHNIPLSVVEDDITKPLLVDRKLFTYNLLRNAGAILRYMQSKDTLDSEYITKEDRDLDYLYLSKFDMMYKYPNAGFNHLPIDNDECIMITKNELEIVSSYQDKFETPFSNEIRQKILKDRLEFIKMKEG